ncbi:MAG: hypothetical protein A2Y73_01815 [Chloroflexi bacterium RBG_13_56_8]|nr:MAG: hypothetical protein A2Y73_01815 [Chloroflexi bacterium RBG_13_56_8]
MELAPAVGLADPLVDLVQTGRTLRENGLVELDLIMQSQAVLVVNRASQVAVRGHTKIDRPTGGGSRSPAG